VFQAREETRVRTVLDHTKLMIARYGEERGVTLMRKHFAWYFKGEPNSKDIRMQLNQATSLRGVEAAILPSLR
jgi:tRNA-dihydrouridine synthase